MKNRYILSEKYVQSYLAEVMSKTPEDAAVHLRGGFFSNFICEIRLQEYRILALDEEWGERHHQWGRVTLICDADGMVCRAYYEADNHRIFSWKTGSTYECEQPASKYSELYNVVYLLPTQPIFPRRDLVINPGLGRGWLIKDIETAVVKNHRDGALRTFFSQRHNPPPRTKVTPKMHTL